ncbi:unnamed protein product [Penicillium roqueforti FM164]|uniref:Genomic scaffold, ProqFM164S02 n=1 Tax=Penicillium roqueforti (strain FM164) TaxID=1365484 RepID=W6QE75_PENRF|nr:unnamed protein product [Penicillium roqueforti FM164]
MSSFPFSQLWEVRIEISHTAFFPLPFRNPSTCTHDPGPEPRQSHQEATSAASHNTSSSQNTSLVQSSDHLSKIPRLFE